MEMQHKSLVICAGVDVMSDRFEVDFWAFGAVGDVWPHASVCLYAGQDGGLPWAALWSVLKRPQRVAGALEVCISAAAIDSGGHHTQEVYEFVRQHAQAGGVNGPHLLAIKGVSQSQAEPMRCVPCDLNLAGQLHVDAIPLWVFNMPVLQAQISQWFAAQCPGPALPDTAAYAAAAHQWLCQHLSANARA